MSKARVIAQITILSLALMVIQQIPAQAGFSINSPADALASAAALETCPAVFAIGVAGTAEPGAPDGSMGAVSSNVIANMAAALPPAVASHVKAVGLPYPAVDIIPGVVGGLIGGVSYIDSRDLGVSTLTAQLYSHANACPDQRFVLVGYSQGADVIATALASLDPQMNVARHVQTHIAGVALLGDPRFDPFDNADAGSYSQSLSGIWNTFPTLPEIIPTGTRPALTTYAGRLKSYCNQGDPICNFSKKNAVGCFGQKAWNLILAGATTGVIGATLTALLDSGDYVKASCPHVRYTANKVKPPTANSAMAGRELANQVLATLYPITMGPTTLPDATAGSHYMEYLTASGGTGAYAWSATGRPSWLSLNSSTGLLSGTVPADAGDAALSVNVTDGYRSVSRNYTLHVMSSPSPPPESSDWTQFRAGAGLTNYNQGETALSAQTVPGLVERWHVTLPSNPDTPLIAASGMGYVLDSAHHLVGIDLNAGSIRWTVDSTLQASSFQLGVPAVANGLVFLGGYTSDTTDPSAVVAVDGSTGMGRWATNDSRCPYVGDGPITVASGRVFATTLNGLCAYDEQTGAVLWATQLPNLSNHGPWEVAVTGSTALVGSRSWFGNNGNTLLAVDTATGKVIWWYSVSGQLGTVAATGETAYVSATDSAGDPFVVALDAATGSSRWNTAVGDVYSQPAGLVVTSQALYAKVYNDQIVLDPSTGARLGQARTGIAGGPAANRLMFGLTDSTSSSIAVTDLATGGLVTTVPITPPHGALELTSIANGMLFGKSYYERSIVAYGLPMR